jgi:hypothetical protein
MVIFVFGFGLQGQLCGFAGGGLCTNSGHSSSISAGLLFQSGIGDRVDELELTVLNSEVFVLI